jgi:predicted RNA binding protein YcfA (HicA-like mRNA interferase family)
MKKMQSLKCKMQRAKQGERQMTQKQKLIAKILTGTSDANIGFDELCGLLKSLGFENRVKGSHHIFYKTDIEEIVNIQPNGNKAKAYQVKQVREIIVKYKLSEL